MQKLNNTVDVIKYVVHDLAVSERIKCSSWVVHVCMDTYFDLLSEVGTVKPGGVAIKTKHGMAYVTGDACRSDGVIDVHEVTLQ